MPDDQLSDSNSFMKKPHIINDCSTCVPFGRLSSGICCGGRRDRRKGILAIGKKRQTSFLD
jgi:hypothetical protein